MWSRRGRGLSKWHFAKPKFKFGFVLSAARAKITARAAEAKARSLISLTFGTLPRINHVETAKTLHLLQRNGNVKGAHLGALDASVSPKRYSELLHVRLGGLHNA